MEHLSYTQNSSTNEPPNSHGLSLIHRVSDTPVASDTFVNEGCYNPRVLIAILNIFRMHYNFFELREYVSPINKDLETEYIPEGIASIAIPGTDQRIRVPKRRRLTPIERRPAERGGILASPKEGVEPKVPDLSRILYQPWLFHGTPLWAKLQGR